MVSSATRPARGSSVATEVVDQLTDATASEEEQQKRTGNLIHGPREFRDVRQDQKKQDAPALKEKR
jgi:hypothetical protein